MKRSIVLGCILAMAPALAGAESSMDKFNAGLKPILTQSAKVQMALSCRFVSGSIAQSAAMKMTTEMDGNRCERDTVIVLPAWFDIRAGGCRDQEWR
jgi:hypothetical protein